jgi:hydroxylamine reductase
MNEEKMFCFQCEQTASCTACTGKAGVCGKPLDVALAQDELTGALIALAQTTLKGTRTEQSDQLIVDGLFTCVTNVNFDRASVDALTDLVRNQTEQIARTSGIEPAHEYRMVDLWDADEDVRSLKSLVLFGIRGMAAYAHHARVLGKVDETVNAFFYEALAGIATLGTQDELLPLVLKVGEVNITCMGLLDAANTGAYGTPEPTKVPLTIEKGPFIVISGHDLKDLELLLEQTDGTGVNVYTHGEMLPAHAYPMMKKHPQLKGNFGTAWQNQQKELDQIPAPVVFTTNCLMPPRASYADRVWTTGLVAFPELKSIGEDKDFGPVIEQAKKLGGYAQDQQLTGINGGHTVTTGFGQGTVLSIADKVVDAVKAGKIRHFFLVGGCDGARPGRNYYTQLVEQIPDDCVILTLACGKYRFNDLDLGDIDGIPRLLDVGQCNDAYGAVQIALALANAFDCSVNELPLSFVLSWYEQKAVCILLSLLQLGIKNIKLGPTLPAFVSENVLNLLVETYGLAPTTTPEKDLAEMLV